MSATRPADVDPADRRTTTNDASAKPEVSVLIVAYNSSALISSCIEAIAAGAVTSSHEILLVDNGDGSTEELVARKYPHVKIVPSRGNIGFAAGNNLLAAEARGSMFLLVNPDMVVAPGSIDLLMKASAVYRDAGAWGGVTVSASGQPDAGNAIALPSLLELASVAIGRSIIGNSSIRGLNEDAEVDVLVGGFVMFSRKAWEEASGLDERYFLYCEEVDLFYRLRKRGYRFWRISAARAQHEAAHGNHHSPRRLLYKTAGTMEYLRAHWSAPARALGAGLIWLAAFERYLAGRLLGKFRPRLRSLGHAYSEVALRPRAWLGGYHPKRGLLSHLARRP